MSCKVRGNWHYWQYKTCLARPPARRLLTYFGGRGRPCHRSIWPRRSGLQEGGDRNGASFFVREEQNQPPRCRPLSCYPPPVRQSFPGPRWQLPHKTLSLFLTFFFFFFSFFFFFFSREAAEMNDERIEGEKEVLLRSIVTLDRAPPNRNRHSQGGGEEGRKERGLHRSSLLGEVKNKIFCLHPAVIGRSTSMGPICFRDR